MPKEQPSTAPAPISIPLAALTAKGKRVETSPSRPLKALEVQATMNPSQQSHHLQVPGQGDPDGRYPRSLTPIGYSGPRPSSQGSVKSAKSEASEPRGRQGPGRPKKPTWLQPKPNPTTTGYDVSKLVREETPSIRSGTGESRTPPRDRKGRPLAHPEDIVRSVVAGLGQVKNAIAGNLVENPRE